MLKRKALSRIASSGIIAVGFSLSSVRIALAQDNSLTNPISSTTFADLVAKLAKAVAAIGVPLVAIFLIWSGFLFVTSQGNEKKLEEAKQAFYWAVIGGAVVVGAYALASAIVNFAQKL